MRIEGESNREKMPKVSYDPSCQGIGQSLPGAEVVRKQYE